MRDQWLFTGRRAVLQRILDWIHTELPGAFVVTGSAGSGKSAVLERVIALSDPAQRRALLEQAPLEPGDPDPLMGALDAAVQLRGMRAHDVATALADRLELPEPENCWQLVEAVAEMPYRPVLAFDGLDEAIAEQATEIVTDLLAPLSAVASVLIATRFSEFGWNQPPTHDQAAALLDTLFRGNASVVDLDAEPDTLPDIERYVARRLHRAGRSDLDPSIAPVLASKAAAQQGGFLYARTVVCQIEQGSIDPRAPGWEAHLAATTTGVLEQDLSRWTRVRDGASLPGAARDLLRALAWGMGRGMPGRGVWEAAATALSPDGAEYRAADLDWVLEHYKCYIIEDEEDGEAVYRLAHREFIDHLIALSPDVAGGTAGQALADALVSLAQRQAGPYLRRHLPRHAVRAGPEGVAALRALAEPGPYLPGLATALDDFAADLLMVGRLEGALIAARHAVETYRALVEANPEAYLPGLATALDSLARRHSDLSRHETALAPAQEAVDLYRRLAETNPDVYFAHLVPSLAHLARQLVALDRISAAVDVYTSCIETFAASPASRDSLIIERAALHINYGDKASGLRELVTLLTLDDGQTPNAVVLTGRTVLRAQRVGDSAMVHRVWRAVTGSEPPDWLALTAAQLGLVTEWIGASNWVESRDFAAEHSAELLDHPTSVVLDELALVARERADLHRHLLATVRTQGVEAAYQPLLLRDLLVTWIKLSDWQDSQSFAEEHATELLTVEAEVALIHLRDPVANLVHCVLLRLARRDGISAAYACVTDRQMAAERMRRALAEVELDPIAELAALEGQVFGERFIGAAHLAVAASLMGEAMTDHTKLEELAARADPADRQQVAAEIADLISRAPEQAELLNALPEILRSPSAQ